MRTTAFGQKILDLICDAVASCEDCGMGFIGWEIGKTDEIVAFCAAKLKKSVRSVAGGLSDLIEKGYLSNELIDEETGEPTNALALTHEAWLQFTRFDASRLHEAYWEPISLEEWKDWDGIDGGPVEFRYKKPEWK